MPFMSGTVELDLQVQVMHVLTSAVEMHCSTSVQQDVLDSTCVLTIMEVGLGHSWQNSYHHHH